MPNSFSTFWVRQVNTPSMPSIWAMHCVHLTWTQLLHLLRKWAAPRRGAKRNWNLMNSFQSSHKSKKKRKWAATKISLSVWNCTTKMRTVWCFSLNWTTLSSPWVRSFILSIKCNSLVFYPFDDNRWKAGWRTSWSSIQGLCGPWRWWGIHPICP